MSRLDDLPPDQRATLSLLLRRSKSYAEVAELLSIQERSVRDRAHAALAVLAPREARGLSAAQREEVGDYLLGQRTGVAERLATRTYLAGSEQARAWAGALSVELEPLAGAPLPEIPQAAKVVSRSAEEAAPPAPSGASADPRAGDLGGSATGPGVRPPAAGSRRGGALLLAGLVVVVIVAVVLIANGGGSSHKPSKTSAATSESAASEPSTGGSAGTSSSGTGSTATTAGTAKEDKRITLTPADPTSHAAGVAEVLSEGSKYAFYLAAERLPPSKGFFYAVWLYNSPTSHEALSKSPPVGANGTLQGGALLPSNAVQFHTMLLTKETSSHPTSPGPVVLRGAFALH